MGLFFPRGGGSICELIPFAIMGSFRVFYRIYKFIKKTSAKLLHSMENMILEVGSPAGLPTLPPADLADDTASDGAHAPATTAIAAEERPTDARTMPLIRLQAH
eukprot:NODE_5304_length_1785_cov_9.135706.p2 GENE.NODE_5304_length_1785_cov_9.135706~~NODE_5304_length_1785_cov_9.135706.p2  ORF type:complete len:104 (-),score=35.06 NODE_5304_length_1785_cov_9.135706:918-1229(-)